MMTPLEVARQYLQKGWRPVAIPAGAKGSNRKGWNTQLLTEEELPQWFGNPETNIGILLGEPSGWLVDIDLDCPDAVELADQFLPPTGAVTGRPSAPRSHRWYVADGLRTKQHRDPTDRSMIVELRSTGGQTLVGPSVHPSGEAYDLLEGEPARVPGPMLAACVAALAEAVVKQRHGEPKPRPIEMPPNPPSDLDVEQRAIAYLNALPPATSGQGGHGATYTAAVALVHGFGLSTDRALHLLLQYYNPRCEPVWSPKELQHKVEDAAGKSHDLPHGWLRDARAEEHADVDLSQFRVSVREPTVLSDEDASTDDDAADPGPIPHELLRVPGFVSEVMDHTLDVAAYPNVTMSFCGALAMQAFLAGRRVRDQADNRTNIYLLALAYSSGGKDWPRKINTQIAHHAGLAGGLGEGFASGEGIQDSLFGTPTMLFQTDEVDGILQSINKAKDARHEYVMKTLLTMYSAANSVFPVRRKAGKGETPGVIDQPCLILFGTAIPSHYYAAMSERMLTNGFFARMIVVESGQRAAGQEPKISDPPSRVLDTARWWSEYHPGRGNLENWHPQPAIVEYTPDAQRVLVESRHECEAEYAQAEQRSDPVGTTVWGRVNENARKLALLYAISENHSAPSIGRAAATWGTQFVHHQARRMLFMAKGYVADNPFHAECLKLLRKLRDAGGQMARNKLMRAMRCKMQDFDQIVGTLMTQGDIVPVEIPTKTKSALGYRVP
ncbi:MAG: bifunctional DNA primase/polymerase [Pirellulaceae bacterium]